MILSGYVSQPQTHIYQGLVNEEEPLPLIIVLSLQIKLHILARISGSLLFNKTNFIPVLEIIYRIILHEKIYTPIQFLPGDLLDGVYLWTS